MVNEYKNFTEVKFVEGNVLKCKSDENLIPKKRIKSLKKLKPV